MYCSLRLQVNISFLVRVFVSPEVCNCFIFSTCLISYSHIFILSQRYNFFIICSPFPPWVLPSKYFYNPLNLNCLLSRPRAHFPTWSFPQLLGLDTLFLYFPVFLNLPEIISSSSLRKVQEKSILRFIIWMKMSLVYFYLWLVFCWVYNSKLKIIFLQNFLDIRIFTNIRWHKNLTTQCYMEAVLCKP